jgi:hypothetical protein
MLRAAAVAEMQPQQQRQRCSLYDSSTAAARAYMRLLQQHCSLTGYQDDLNQHEYQQALAAECKDTVNDELRLYCYQLSRLLAQTYINSSNPPMQTADVL